MKIDVQNLTRYYGDFTAVDDVSFSIGQGEIVGLLGHNGAGKTTIMKMMTGFLEPTSGVIEYDGRAFATDTQAIQKRMGYLPENCPIWPDMTVMDYLVFQADLHQIPESQRQQDIAMAIRRTALKEKATTGVRTLSRGFRQRLGVAQAILHHPDIIILDEPTNGLDPTQILHMRALIQELAKTATVVISTHVLQEVQAVCERVLIMRSGRLIIDSRLDDLQQVQKLCLTVNQELNRTLETIPGIEKTELQRQENNQYHYAITADANTAPAIATAIHHAGVELYRLHPEQRSLESVFAQVNTVGKESRYV